MPWPTEEEQFRLGWYFTGYSDATNGVPMFKGISNEDIIANYDDYISGWDEGMYHLYMRESDPLYGKLRITPKLVKSIN